ncbi:unnamed protein product [Adineta steineri]|uniref:EF-hand domain-containing protein n=1 Tax=Adineta steineri TaxID=433720 RepID=A0A814JX44_9BILA|nr:unnamed protein product [Adineta steineri]
MENLATINQTDINNGVLNRMLAKAGIPDVQEYINQFHNETENLIVEEFEHPDLNKVDNNEQIASPTDVQNWITGLRLRLDDPIQTPLPQQQQSQEIPPPKDIKTWMHRMGPSNVHSSTETTIDTTEITTINNDINPANGDLGTWLNQWSKSLTEQPPPTSLDNWLKGLVPDNMHEPLSKANSSKGRLNSYLNAAEQVLSKHGYDVSNEVKPSTNVKVKSGMFGNVKQMYFLWKTLDKNNDRKITVEDVQIMLEEMGLGFISKYAAKTLFEMVDTNHDGELQFRDFVALMGIIKQLVGAVGSAK